MISATASHRNEAEAVPLTVRGLTEIPYLETRFYAGLEGGDRVITWAHSIEVAEPWKWLEAGDLLMTVGLGLPTAAEEQREYVERLAEIEVSGLALGEGFPLPPLSAEMTAAADRCRLPVLFIGWNVPFAQISRTVAAANYGPQLDRLVKAIRVYDLVRSSVAARAKAPELLKNLEREIGCRIYICANETGRAAFADEMAPPPPIAETFWEAAEEHEGRLPGFLRLAAHGETLLVVPIPTQRPASLLAVPRSEVPPFALLQHVATVAAMELERMWSRREELRRLGSETLTQLLEGRSIQGSAELLERLGVTGGPLVLLAISSTEEPDSIADLHNTLADESVPNLLLQRGEALYALVEGDPSIATKVTELLPTDSRIGISAPFDDPTEVPTALQQAKWALGATSDERPVAHHGQAASLFGPRSPSEAQMTVDEILGAILDYDREHGTELLHSLKVFLLCNRSWKRATAELFVHKQTLVYRIQRVEQLTGRKLTDTGDVAELWLALRAHEMVS